VIAVQWRADIEGWVEPDVSARAADAMDHASSRPLTITHGAAGTLAS
jgi:hypothetical protein